MTFKQIELFVLVCQYKSITRVSEVNFVSPQSISRMIKDLETELNTSLLHRTNNGVTLTEAGVYFQEGCMEILEKKENLIDGLLSVNTREKEVISIGMATGSIAALNYHIFDDFQISHPNIEINYTEHIDSELIERFLKGEFDICISPKPIDTNSYQNTKLLSEKVYLSIPKQHDLYDVPTITLDDLRNFEFAMFTDSFHIRSKFLRCFESTDFIPDIKISLNDFNSIKNLAYENNLLSLDVHHSLKKEHGFRHVLFPCSKLSYDLWMVQRISNQSNTINSLCEYIEKRSL